MLHVFNVVLLVTRMRPCGEEVILQIRCSRQIKIAFKTLAAELDENYAETLKRLLAMEKQQPLEKKMKGLIKHV